MTTGQDDRFGRLFDLYDADRDGAISRADIDLMYQRVTGAFELADDSAKATALQHYYEQAWQQLQLLDTDGDGSISRAEYVAAVTNPPAAESAKAAPSEAELAEFLRPGLEAEFATADTDDDGEVSRAEFVRLLVAFGVSEPEAGAAFDGLDRDRSDSLTRAEYCSTWLNYTLGSDSTAALIGSS